MKRRFRVMRMDRTGAPKRVRDLGTAATLERIVAQVGHKCSYHACHHEGYIAVSTTYVRVNRVQEARRIGSRVIPVPHDFHQECLPPELRDAARLLFGDHRHFYRVYRSEETTWRLICECGSWVRMPKAERVPAA